MKLRSLIGYPATVLVPLAGLYVVLRVAPGHRTETFAMLAMTAVGATELMLAIVSVSRRQARAAILAHALTGVGGLAVGYSLFDGWQPSVATVGSLLFAAGVFVGRRIVSLPPHA